MTTDTKRQAILTKVRAILDKAESTTYGAERDAFLAKADELMLRYAIAEQELVDAGKAPDTKPELRNFEVCRTGNPLREELVDLVSAIVRYTRGRVVYSGLRFGKKQDYPITAKVVSFPSDLDYIEMLLTSLNLQLANEMEPRPDPAATVMENMTTLKATGMKWNRVFEVLGVRDPEETAEYTKDERRLVSQWRRWMKDQGREEELKGIHPTSYQRSYAQGFVTAVINRLHEQERQRKAREHRDAGTSGESTALVLRSREQMVDEALAAMFPSLGAAPRRADGKLDARGYARGSEAGKRADLSRPGTRIAQRKGLTGS